MVAPGRRRMRKKACRAVTRARDQLVLREKPGRPAAEAAGNLGRGLQRPDHTIPCACPRRGCSARSSPRSRSTWAGRHTRDYYRVMQEVQGGSYQPERDATPWIAFCIQAHLAQARFRLEQIAQAGRRWSHLEQIPGNRRWPDRLVIALEQALIGGTDRGRYSAEADISLATATNDLRRLFDSGLISQQGRGRNTRYHASQVLRDELPDSRSLSV